MPKRFIVWNRQFLIFTLSLFIVNCTVNNPFVPRPPHVTQNPSTGTPTEPSPGSLGSNPSEITRNQVFPYQINIDTISYMGCPDPSPNDPIFTSFKLGAYSKGLQLTDEFKEETSEYNADQKQMVLRDSSLINSQGQVSISKKENVRDIIKNFTSEFPSINNPTTLKNLAERDVTHTIGVNNPIETTLPIPGNMLPDILAYLSANYHIALTYNNGSHDAYPLGPGQNQYYGRFYHINFDRNLRYMENIEEYDLLTGNRISRWSCPERSRLMVLRHEQISEQAHAHPKLKEWLDYYNAPREAVCVEDRGALSRVGKQSLENLLPDNLFAVGFVHIWEKEGNRFGFEKNKHPLSHHFNRPLELLL